MTAVRAVIDRGHLAEGAKLQDGSAGSNPIDNVHAANGDLLPVSADAFNRFG